MCNLASSWILNLMSFCVLSRHSVDSPRSGFWQIQDMNKPLSPRIRSMIINYDPTQSDALMISEFCKTQRISRSIFYRIRAGSSTEAALHSCSSAPYHPALRYGTEVINELDRIRKQLQKDGWTAPESYENFYSAFGRK